MGKPISEGKSECIKSANFVDFYTENFERILEQEEIKTEASQSFVRYEPLGPLYYIMPWNFPVFLPCKGIAQLLARNTVLLKPAPGVLETSLSYQSILEEAGWKDFHQMLWASEEDTDHIVSNPKIHGVSFTGSSAVGKVIGEISGRHGKRCVLELGGNDPFIVLDDADVEKAVKACMQA